VATVCGVVGDVVGSDNLVDILKKGVVMSPTRDYDRWKTSGPEECSCCGAEGHTRRFCPVWKAGQAEADEMKADELRDERAFFHQQQD